MYADACAAPMKPHQLEHQMADATTVLASPRALARFGRGELRGKEVIRGGAQLLF